MVGLFVAMILLTAPATAMILPIRVFADEAEKRKCVNFIHARLRKSNRLYEFAFIILIALSLSTI